ncbi:MAG: FAD-binding oxidoreductase, partial [Chloroflexi bacterium]|nr:FAD-binding oxidoreductase [Chloroflexota bacterium]
WRVATDIVPAVAAQRVDQRWGGLEAQSFDGVPFIGPLPGLSGAFVAVGFSGHGFQLSPAVGRALADLVGGASVPELAPFATGRLQALDSAAVEAFKRAPLSQPVGTITQ